MNKEIKDRLDKLENEFKESKNEIHSLKSSVSLTIERKIRKVLSRFSRKQIIFSLAIILFSFSIIGTAGTVTKTYTFSSGDLVSAEKINTNFDTLFNLVDGNLDLNNISIISDGSADGYMKIGNMLIIWGSATVTQVGTTITFPKSFLNTPKVLIQGIHSNGTSQNVTNVTTTSAVLSHGWGSDKSFPYDYLVVGKWQ